MRTSPTTPPPLSVYIACDVAPRDAVGVELVVRARPRRRRRHVRAPLAGDTADGIALVGLFLLAMGSLRWPVAQPKRRQCVSGNWDLHTRTPNTSVERAPCETHAEQCATQATGPGHDRLL